MSKGSFLWDKLQWIQWPQVDCVRRPGGQCHRSEKASLPERLMPCGELIEAQTGKIFCWNDKGRRHFLQQGNHTMEWCKLIFPACSSWMKLCGISKCSGRRAAFQIVPSNILFPFIHIYRALSGEGSRRKWYSGIGNTLYIWCKPQMYTWSPIQFTSTDHFH